MFIQLTNLCFPCCYDARLVDYDLVRDMEKGSLCFVLHNDIEAVELDGTKRVNTLKGNHIQGNFVAGEILLQCFSFPFVSQSMYVLL